MKFIPLTVSTPLIPPILARKKTRTRRLAKIPPLCEKDLAHILTFGYKLQNIPCPYEVGDILWVKEEHYAFGEWVRVEGEFTPTGLQKMEFVPDPAEPKIFYSDCRPNKVYNGINNQAAYRKRLARFMPARHARLFLKVTEIKLEKLQDITEDQAMDEGVECGIYREGPNTLKGEFQLELNHHGTYRAGFRYTFQTLHGRDIWDQNPAVWAISFELIDKPLNFPKP